MVKLLPAKKLIIHRKKKFASALMPFWIITNISKADFMKRHQISDDISCDIDQTGQPAPRIDFNPDDYGVRILNGETIEIEISESTKSVFAITLDGLLSNEVTLNPTFTSYKIDLSTKGGFKTPSYPYFILCHQIHK